MATKHDLKLRQKEELKKLRSEKPAGKGAKKELQQREADMLERHAKELEDFGKEPPSGPDASPSASAASPPAKQSKMEDEDSDDNDSGSPAGQNESKAQKRRARKDAKDKARTAELQAEAATMKDNRSAEDAALRERLTKENLQIQQIPPDGHCLFNSIADQLKKKNVDRHLPMPAHESLRKMAADYMRDHPDDFMPFIQYKGDAPTQEEFEQYCKAVTAQDPVLWGGQLETRALAEALQCTIVVHSADAPPQRTSPAGVKDAPELHVSFHRYAYALGEHYNSLH